MTEENSHLESDNVQNPILITSGESEENASFRFRTLYSEKAQSFSQVIHNSLQEILSAYIDPLIKQWIKNFHIAALLVLGLIKKIGTRNLIPVPRQVSGLNLLEKDRIILSKGIETELIEGFTSKSGKKFNAYLKLDRLGKVQYRFPNTHDQGANEKNILGKIEEIPGKPPDLIPKVLLGVELNEEIRECLRKGIETPLVMGLKSKKGNVFNAYLRMNLNGELKFRFPTRTYIPLTGKEESVKQTEPNPVEKHPSILEKTQENSTVTKKEISEEIIQKPESISNSEKLPETRGQPEINIKPEISQPILSETQLIQEPMKNLQTLSPISNSGSNREIISQPIPEIIFGQKLYNINLRTLESGKETELIKGFISPSGKVFDAYLKLVPPNHIQFRIPSREKDLKINFIPKIILGVTLSEQNKSILKLGQETPLLSNFKFQNSKPFQAYLRRDEKGNLIIRTPPVKKQIPLQNLNGGNL